jgi:ABC-type glycerol-3-phosphate transport system substrate-binding protein
MKIRFAVLSALVIASVATAACSDSPTSADSRHRSVTAVTTTDVIDTTTRGGGLAGSGH